jgi:hypothetical protein
MAASPRSNPTPTETAPAGQDPKPPPAKIIVEYRNPKPQVPWVQFAETDDHSWAKEILQACRNFFPACECRIRRRTVASEPPPG